MLSNGFWRSAKGQYLGAVTYLAAIALFCGLLFIVGCTNPDSQNQVDQFKEGEQLYASYCASCHEIENGIGPHLSKEVVATRVNAQLLFNYNKRNMPYQAGNTLTEKEYWAITAFMLRKDDFIAPDLVLSEENAADILLVVND